MITKGFAISIKDQLELCTKLKEYFIMSQDAIVRDLEIQNI